MQTQWLNDKRVNGKMKSVQVHQFSMRCFQQNDLFLVFSWFSEGIGLINVNYIKYQVIERESDQFHISHVSPFIDNATHN